MSQQYKLEISIESPNGCGCINMHHGCYWTMPTCKRGQPIFISSKEYIDIPDELTDEMILPSGDIKMSIIPNDLNTKLTEQFELESPCEKSTKPYGDCANKDFYRRVVAMKVVPVLIPPLSEIRK
jgi:hypothetical protein